MEGFDLHFHPMREENYGVAAVETGGKQMSTGHLHLDGFKFLFPTTKNKEDTRLGVFFIWRREWDSNPRCVAASPVFKTGSLNRSDISPLMHTIPFPKTKVKERSSLFGVDKPVGIC